MIETGQAWAEFFEAHHRAIAAYAGSLVPDLHEAEDLVQDSLLRMVRDDRRPQNAVAYFYQVLRRLAIDRRRKQSLPAEACDPAFIDLEAGSLEQQERSTRVRDALLSLEPVRREVIVLRSFAQMSFREIAEVMDLPPGTVASHYARALGTLRGMMQEVTDAT